MAETRHSALQVALTESLGRVQRLQGAFGQRFPTVGEGNRYQLAENNHWLAGFWTGLLWLTYATTRDDEVKGYAMSLLPSFEARLDRRIHITHDLGFLFSTSARAQWQLIGDLAARDLVLKVR